MTTSEITATEYLYGTHTSEDDRGHLVERVIPFQITKKTPKRIYYVRHARPNGQVQLGYVNRQHLEANGEIYNHGAGGWWAPDFHLYLEPPDLQAHRAAPDLAALKQAMADAHPDRGGTGEAFIAARAQYEHALRRATPNGVTVPAA